jgi:hypothetical protein
MSNRREMEQKAKSFSNKLDHFLHHNTKYAIHGVARQGSRKDGTHSDYSDLDIVIALPGDPKNTEIYPELASLISSKMNVKAEIGEQGNAINITKGDLEVDLVLLTIHDFEEQIRDNKLKRITKQE